MAIKIMTCSQLDELEAIIQKGLATFVEVGNALLQIRDTRGYVLAGYATFEAYCNQRWSMSRPRAYQLIEAATVAQNLSTIVDKLPATESQARPLTQLEPDEQRAAWARAVETAPNGKVTAAHVLSVVKEGWTMSPHVAITDQYGHTSTVYVDDEHIKPHVAHNSGQNEWYTPPEYIAAAVAVMGAIDLDPASSDIANRIVKAKRYYTSDDDGLTKRWRGRVWLNPPYASELIAPFVEKLVESFSSGAVSESIVLVNNATETAWFANLVSVAKAIVFTKGRVKFLDPQGKPGAPLQGQAVIYMGGNIRGFVNHFKEFGWVAKL